MNSFPKLTETAIRQRASDTSFERGYDYYKKKTVLIVIRRGNQLFAEVEGSSYKPYQVSVTMSEHGIEDANCTCPYDWAGDCKHIVAVLLVYIHSSEAVKEHPSVETLLADLDRDQLQTLILRLVERQPNLTNVIQSQLSVMQTLVVGGTSDPEVTSPLECRIPLDQTPFRHQVRAALHSLDYMRPFEAYWAVGNVVDDLRGILGQARTFVEAGDGRNASVILEAITEEYMDRWEFLDDSEGESSGFFNELGSLWIEAILLVDLTPAEREEWGDRLEDWQAVLDGYGFDDVFSAAREAAIQSWDYPPLQRVLRGVITDLGAWEGEAPRYADDLAVARLNILARQGRTQEYLYLAEAEGQTKHYVTMLVQLGHIREAVNYGLDHLTLVDEALTLAQALHARGELELALHVAEHGLKLRGEHSALARWIRDVATTADQPERALNATIIAVREAPNLTDYQAAQTLAGERWPELREKLLAHLQKTKSRYPEAHVNIFLYEGRVDDAIAALGDFTHYTLLEKVADAAISTRPDWVIRVCCQQAEHIMNAGKSEKYHHAVNWLKKARAAYLAVDRQAEWEKYLADLLVRHKRRYKLVPMLRELQ
ncbi:MAG: SWIM zinc finger domain-containing protein [Candidatus Heimdallarchaeota archaeon]